MRIHSDRIRRCILNGDVSEVRGYCCALEAAEAVFYSLHNPGGYQRAVHFFETLPRRTLHPPSSQNDYCSTMFGVATSPENIRNAIQESQFLELIQRVTDVSSAVEAMAILEFVDVHQSGIYNFRQFYLLITLLSAMGCHNTSLWFFMHKEELLKLFQECGEEQLLGKVSCLANLLTLPEIAVVRYLVVNHDFDHNNINIQRDEDLVVCGLFEMFKFFDQSTIHAQLRPASKYSLDTQKFGCAIL